jgi:hypothetical protein
MKSARPYYAVSAIASAIALVVSPAVARAIAHPGARPAATAAASSLPLDRYLVPDAKVAAVARAQTELTLACLRSLGVRPDSGVAAVPPTAFRPLIGYLSPGQAARTGYGSLAGPGNGAVSYADGYTREAYKPSRSELAALFGKTARVNGHRVPAGGCKKQAVRELHAGVGTLPADPRAAELAAQFAALRDPRMASASSRWSSCMRQRGFSYQTPLQAARDPRWARPGLAGMSYRPAATRPEVATAVADARCQSQTGLFRTWTAVNRAFQDTIIATAGPRLAQATTIVDGWLRNARRYGADTPATTAAPAAITWNGPFTYQNVWTGLYLDVRGASCANGAWLDAYYWRNQTNQYWWFSNPLTGSGRALLVDNCDQLRWPEVVEDFGYSRNQGGAVDQWAWVWNSKGTAPQDNELTDIIGPYSYGNGSYIIYNDYSGNCIMQTGSVSAALRWEGPTYCGYYNNTYWH